MPGARAAQGDCAQPISSGSGPSASDCLFILKAAVGSVVCSPACICDPDNNGRTSAVDALMCLKVAVGQPIPLMCCQATTTTTTTSTTTPTTSSTTTTTLPLTTTTQAVTTTTVTTTTTVPQIDRHVFSQACIEVTLRAGTLGGSTVRQPGSITLEVLPGQVTDLDSDGLEEVPIEFTQIFVTGNQGTFGTVTIQQNNNVHPSIDQRSLGTLEETVNTTSGVLDLPPYAASGSATLSIDLYLEATLGGLFLPPDRGHNDVPITLVGTVSAVPPAAGEILLMQNSAPVTVLFDNDVPYSLFGNTLTIDVTDKANVDLNATSCP